MQKNSSEVAAEEGLKQARPNTVQWRALKFRAQLAVMPVTIVPQADLPQPHRYVKVCKLPYLFS
jgi:hypothetical protein